MLMNIARFEFRYLLRNPLLWITAIATFGLMFIGTSAKGFELGSEGGLLVNAAYATVRNYVMVTVFYVFVTTAFVANAVIRDEETGYGPIIRSTPITKFDYVIGRFLGAFSISALCMLAVPLGLLAGSSMPWADAAQVGPQRLADHLYGYFLIALPNLFVQAAIFFALATMTRSLMATYLGVMGFVSGFILLEGGFRDNPRLQTIVDVAEPFASRAMSDAVRYWTVAERNVMLPPFAGTLLYNRLLWITIGVASLALAYRIYRFADRGISKREKKKLAEPGLSGGGGGPAGAIPSPNHNTAARRALLWLRTKFEMKQVIVSPAFPVLLAWGLFTTFFVLLTQRDPEGRPRYPTTLVMIPKIEGTVDVLLLIVAVYYAGELVWRERDRKVHELIDASPMPNWGYVVPKTLAMALVLVSILLTNVVAAVGVQMSLGYSHIEIGKYLLWYVLPQAWDTMLMAAVAVLVQALSPHKAVGWAVMVALLIAQQLNHSIHHNLLLYGGSPAMPLSDMNGASTFWIGTWTFRLYWGAFALLLLLVAHLMWRRGTETRLRPRLAFAGRRMGGGAGWVAAAAVAVFAVTGAYAFYNTNVLNRYRTADEYDARTAQFEKTYWKYHDLPQPEVARMTLNVDVYPGERRVMTRGEYLLRNETTQPIAEVHVRLPYSDLELLRSDLAGARLISDDRTYSYRIYRLDAPMRPGDQRVLTFATRRWHRGFVNGYPYTGLVRNGTFINRHELTPIIGMSAAGLLEDPATRAKYGLPPNLMQPAKLENVGAMSKPAMGAGWATADITVSTVADQVPIAPGSKVSDVTRGGRRIARFVSNALMHPTFSIQSARYAEKHRRHAGVDLAVYYHPEHPWNVDRMLDALEVSLDYFQANFGPYQFDHVRIVEFPGYRYFAQAFSGTIPYSETYGFIADVRNPETIDIVSGTTAHELAHQYWAHQVIGANMEGEGVLSETLAQYSALMVMKKIHGEDQIRRHLQYELDRYLESRGYASTREPVLARVTSEHWVMYNKGSVVMYLLQKRLGEDAVNRALRNLLARYKFKGAPYPRTLELIAALRAEAKTAEQQNLITDLFERITLYDFKTIEPSAVRRADGTWDVTVPVEAKKLYANGHGSETEAPLDESIEVGLFTAEPGRTVFHAADVVLMERQPIHSGRQVLHFVTDRKPAYAGIDPYNFYIDRNSADNVAAVR